MCDFRSKFDEDDEIAYFPCAEKLGIHDGCDRTIHDVELHVVLGRYTEQALLMERNRASTVS